MNQKPTKKKTVNIDPKQKLAEALIFGVSGMIERDEALGQASLVNSTNLPIKGDWKTLQRWGVIQGEAVDDLFCAATLPTGWQLKATDHSMWSNLVDARGLVRGSVFYKAAFYDRDAFVRCTNQRFVAGDALYDATKGQPMGGAEIMHFPGVQDVATGAWVRLGTPIYYGVLSQEKNRVGVICGDIFYYGAVEAQRGILGSKPERFTKTCSASLAQRITRDDFYGDYHNRERTDYGTLDAAKAMNKAMANALMTNIPTDDSAWNPEWDMPALEVTP